MFCTKNVVIDIREVPSSWIFEHYCKLPEQLNGQETRIRSLWTRDTNPSMMIYIDDKDEYRFRDFSSGRSGSGIDLVQQLTGLGYIKACEQIILAYDEYTSQCGPYQQSGLKRVNRYQVEAYNVRTWNTDDETFWKSNGISSTILDEYCVRPLELYTMCRVGDPASRIVINGNYIYGYFKKDGTLYKIYQPRNPEKKFIKVADYIQGTEQLKGHQNLLIVSSLKDLMSTVSLKINIDIVAPDSETAMLPQTIMQQYLDQYHKVIVLFDYDDAGIAAMKVYKKNYPEVEVTVLPMKKDIADSVQAYGRRKVRDRLVPILDRKLQTIVEL